MQFAEVSPDERRKLIAVGRTEVSAEVSAVVHSCSMFLFISSASPIASLVSLLIFGSTLVLSTPFTSLPPPLWTALPLVCWAFMLLSYSFAREPELVPENPRAPRPPVLDPDALRHLIAQLPLEIFYCAESRAALDVRALRERLRRRRVPLAGLCERKDLTDALEACPHDDICSICHESFSDGDELRLLACNHAFHSTSCIDRWLLDCGQNRRCVACPLCNAPAVDTSRCAEKPAAAETGPWAWPWRELRGRLRRWRLFRGAEIHAHL